MLSDKIYCESFVEKQREPVRATSEQCPSVLSNAEGSAVNRLIAGLSVPLLICRPRSFALMHANALAHEFFGYEELRLGSPISEHLPGTLVDQIRFGFFDKSQPIHRGVFSWPRLDGVRELKVDAFGLTSAGPGGAWILRLTDITSPLQDMGDEAFGDSRPMPLSGELPTFSRGEFYTRGQMEFTLQMAKESERAKLGAELHDSLGQEITVAQLGMSLLRNLLTELPDVVPSKLDILTQVADLSRQLSALALTSRRIAFGLRPTSLTTKGFGGAARDLVHGFMYKFGIEGTLHTDKGWINPRDDVSLHLYRCLQEMMNNIVKHSKATRFHVIMGEHSGISYLEVYDNGVGIPRETIDDDQSLYTLKARAKDIGGKVRVKSRPELDGTRVRIVAKW